MHGRTMLVPHCASSSCCTAIVADTLTGFGETTDATAGGDETGDADNTSAGDAKTMVNADATKLNMQPVYRGRAKESNQFNYLDQAVEPLGGRANRRNR